MKFKTSDNLIDLLVGQSLYSSPDVAMRELLQNAEDACHLQSLEDPSHKPEIVVRYSVAENWVEVSDNGLGMDLEVFEDSFATIGASKTNSPKLKALLEKAGSGNRPIGQFGIGILSCFGVAEVVEVRSCAESSTPVSVRILDRREAFEQLSDHRESRGTTLRLLLKPGGPMQAQHIHASVVRYVRHAHHIWIENVDSGEGRTVVPEQWLLETWLPSSAMTTDAVESGHLQLSDAWENINLGLDVQLVLSNAGFLVNNAATGVLPEFAIGLRGELNIRPGGLTILMSREGFQQDARWSVFVAELTAHYSDLVAEILETWLNSDLKNTQYDKLRAMQRMALLILGSSLGQVVGNDNIERARRLIPNVLLLADGRASDFDALVNKARLHPPLYVHRTDDQQQVQRNFSDRGQNFSLTETVRSLDLRVSLLKLNGFAVARVERHDYTINNGTRNQNVNIHDFDILNNTCSSLGISIKKVQEAPAEDTTIGSSPDAEAITRLFEMSSELKFQSVDSMTDAIIADFNGYILNVGNTEIRSILDIMPAAVGNPVRKDLLSAYLALSTYNVSLARSIIFRLITDPEFESKARRSTGRFFRVYLEERVKALLASKETHDA